MALWIAFQFWRFCPAEGTFQHIQTVSALLGRGQILQTFLWQLSLSDLLSGAFAQVFAKRKKILEVGLI